jgi:hypothetical protein
MKLDSIKKMRWQRVVAAVVLCGLLCLYTVISLFGINSTFIINLAISFWSMQLVFVYVLLLLIPCFERWWATALMLLPLALLFAWQTASVMLYHIQCRFFSFDELVHLLGNSHTRPLVLEQLFTFKFLLFIIMFYGVYYLTEYLLQYRYAVREEVCALVVPAVLILMVAGQFLTADFNQAQRGMREQRMCCMVWSFIGNPDESQPVADPVTAAALWVPADNPFWVPGASALAEAIKGSCKDRSIVIILLESHGLVQVVGFGQGSRMYKPSSPHLSRLASELTGFTNYIQSGYTTSTAAWSILSGFPFCYESVYTPQLLQLGPVQAFQDAGYQIEWLKAADIHY